MKFLLVNRQNFGVCDLHNLSGLNFDGVVFEMHYGSRVPVTAGGFEIQTSYIYTSTILGLVGCVTKLYVRGS